MAYDGYKNVAFPVQSDNISAPSTPSPSFQPSTQPDSFTPSGGSASLTPTNISQPAIPAQPPANPPAEQEPLLADLCSKCKVGYTLDYDIPHVPRALTITSIVWFPLGLLGLICRRKMKRNECSYCDHAETKSTTCFDATSIIMWLLSIGYVGGIVIVLFGLLNSQF